MLADIIFTCTGSSNPVITNEILQKAIELNNNRFEKLSRKLIIIDIAVPHDLEDGVEVHPPLEIYRLEAIESYLKDQQERQRLAIPQAKAIVEKLMGEFAYWYNHVKFEPVYNGLGKTFEEIRKQEMDRVMNLVPENIRIEIEKATDRLTSRLLHLKARV